MNLIRNIALSTVLLGGMTAAAVAQLPEPIDPDPGFEFDWVTLGVATFEETEDQSVNIGTWEGRDLDMIALQPLTAGISCVDMKLDIEGRPGAYEFPIEREGELNEDRIYKIPIRGEDRNITGLELTCRSTTGETSIVQLYGIPSGVSGGARTPY